MDQTISKGFVFLENAPELMRLLEDIFTDDFMQEYTRFESFEGFRYSSAVMVNWKADTLIYAPPLLDALDLCYNVETDSVLMYVAIHRFHTFQNNNETGDNDSYE